MDLETKLTITKRGLKDQVDIRLHPKQADEIKVQYFKRLFQKLKSLC